MKALLLAAGFGTRLKPLTDIWPKCLMPIGGVPLLEYWIDAVRLMGADRAIVNTHYMADVVDAFLARPKFEEFVHPVYEGELLGTAGTLRANREHYRNEAVVLVHADNWCVCDFRAFADYHRCNRPEGTVMTMMTFTTDTPESCGIIEQDGGGVVVGYQEKPSHPKSTHANAAVYILEPEVVKWVVERPDVSDFSTQVIPHFIGRIATWHNDGIHRDIGTPESLAVAQRDKVSRIADTDDAWLQVFHQHPVQRKVNQLVCF
ncbi:nucleotidyltransferase family protein [Chlorobium phaeovibrioides]|uniref:Nucleotidyltransferase family protein n=1 Tax=Chlorobium phaeovibrioides TaxID=1094 RepID=A0A432AUQ0_CHLPH|nr:nucleotidyltransferase family protein [Chlorobium phaeovibrioides]RTY38352.1 nucleotidyltransferase family protein [Chlorobium phaeovibrioides]